MRMKKKVSIEEVNYLEEIDAERVSLVNRGANLTPLAIFKSEDQISVMRVEFDSESYTKETANDYMKAMFDEDTYELSKSDTKYVAKSLIQAEDGDIRTVELDEGVALVINKPTLSLSKQETKCDTLEVSPNEEKVRKKSMIDEIINEVRVKLHKAVEADKEVKEISEAEEVEAKSEDEGKEEVKATTEEVTEEKSEEAKEETEEKSEETETEAKSDEESKEKEDLCKFDYFSAIFSESSELSEVLKEGMSDGIPVGFDELTVAFTTAMSNAIKKGEEEKVAILANEFGRVLQGIVDLTKSEEAVEKTEETEEVKEEVVEKSEEEAKEEKSEEVAKTDELDALNNLGTKLDNIAKSLEEKVSLETVKDLVKEEINTVSEAVTKLADQFEGLRYAGGSNAVRKQSEIKKSASEKKDGPGSYLFDLLND